MANTLANHQKRCKNCNHWFNGIEKTCPKCGEEHNKKYRQEIENRKLNGDLTVPVWKIHDNDPLWLIVIKKPVQVIQLMLYAIIAFLVYLSTAFAH